MKKVLSMVALGAAIVLAGCSKGIKVNPDKEKYIVGIAQFGDFEALNRSTAGFKDKLAALLTAEGRQVEWEYQNANGELTLAKTIVDTIVNKDVDLILANATPCLTAAYNATSYIPILGTSITDYGVACNIEIQNGITKTNLSGTSDLAPLDQQANELKSWFDANAKPLNKVGLLYCSAEANSKFQIDEIEKAFSTMGIASQRYAFSESNQLLSICQTAADAVDAIYIPTDNTCADNTGIIDSVFADKHIPVYAGEEGICFGKKGGDNPTVGCGFATLSIDYYRLGEITGEMAFDVLLGKKSITEYQIQYDKNPVKKYDETRATALGFSVVPAGYEKHTI